MAKAIFFRHGGVDRLMMTLERQASQLDLASALSPLLSLALHLWMTSLWSHWPLIPTLLVLCWKKGVCTIVNTNKVNLLVLIATVCAPHHHRNPTLGNCHFTKEECKLMAKQSKTPAKCVFG